MKRIVLKKLVLSGVDKKDAVLKFTEGLNVISGDSDTGKTYAFQCINYMLGAEDRLEKAAMIISTVLSIGIVLFIIIVIAMVNASNKQEEDLLRCRNPYYCEPSDGDYQTCYYCNFSWHSRYIFVSVNVFDKRQEIKTACSPIYSPKSFFMVS